jgi:hypothetical protein
MPRGLLYDDSDAYAAGAGAVSSLRSLDLTEFVETPKAGPRKRAPTREASLQQRTLRDPLSARRGTFHA